MLHPKLYYKEPVNVPTNLFSTLFIFVVTDPPKFMAGQTETKVVVTETTANSKVGFQTTVASVNEGNFIVEFLVVLSL